MFELLFIPHKEVNIEQLREIINIKSKAWAYSFDQQLKWIENNLKKNDIHVLLSLNKTNIAYLNLIEVEFKIEDYTNSNYGIGNVCAIEKGKGWGKEIITQTNLFLIQKNKIGLLFCKNELVNFYIRNNWILVEKKKLILSFNNVSIETMIFNYCKEFQHLEYLGKSF